VQEGAEGNQWYRQVAGEGARVVSGDPRCGGGVQVGVCGRDPLCVQAVCVGAVKPSAV